ncbi:MAG: phosphopentomutase [Oscillospiraceae bacterium]|nr:phosphopentomutase [Oscillospiraceae bacterium]
MSRAVLVVLDSFGVGALPDAGEYGDEGVHTLGHIQEVIKDFKIPNMRKLGLYNIDGLELEKETAPTACFCKSLEKAPAKDTTTGHFEMTGLILEKPYKIFMDGFPKRITDELEKRIGTKVIGNYLISGTEIIKILGEEHVRTGYPIIYTSADSLMQIAMHEDVIPLNRQYEICQIARDLLMGDDTVSRIICRPFTGNKEVGFTRTENRRDFSIDPPGKTVLDYIKEAGKDVIAVGKLEDIFNRIGITEVDHTKNNHEGIESLLKHLDRHYDGLLFVNLVDFDMLYGHRRDVRGYATALEYFDARLPEILAKLKDDDMLIITADHGCDPTAHGTDHTREYVPILVYGPQLKQGVNLHVRETFADIAATIAEKLGIDFNVGSSFLKEVMK